MKILFPLILAIAFMFSIFAASHYFDNLWFEIPTMILSAFITVIMSCFSIANFIDRVKPKSKHQN